MCCKTLGSEGARAHLPRHLDVEPPADGKTLLHGSLRRSVMMKAGRSAMTTSLRTSGKTE